MSGDWKEHNVIPITIASGTGVTESSVANISDYSHIGLIAPALTTGSVSFDVSADNISFYRLKGSDGTELKVGAGAGSAAYGELPALAPWSYVKLITATQAAARTVQFILKT